MPTQAELAELNEAKLAALELLRLRLNGLTQNALTRYPQAEVESWPIQREQAAIIIAAGDKARLDMAPFIAGVCAFQFGTTDIPGRLAQVKEKAVVIKANADAWELVSQFVGGTRARVELQIMAAETVDEVGELVSATVVLIEDFRIQSGI